MTENESAIAAVAFDAAGTVIHALPSIAECYCAVGRQFGSALTTDQIAERFRVAFGVEEDRDRRNQLRTDEPREQARWESIVATVLDDTTDPQACFEELYRRLGTADVWQLFDDVEPTLAVIESRGLKVLVASNFDARLRTVARGHDALAQLPLVISSEVGYRKPHPEFFAAVVEKAGVDAGSILFVGDDVENDLEGARGAGLQALLIDRASPDREDSISDLRQLTERL